MSLVGFESRSDHVARLFGGLGAGVHGHGHVGLCQAGESFVPSPVDANQVAGGLIGADQTELGFGSRFGKEVVDAGSARSRRPSRGCRP